MKLCFKKTFETILMHVYIFFHIYILVDVFRRQTMMSWRRTNFPNGNVLSRRSICQSWTHKIQKECSRWRSKDRRWWCLPLCLVRKMLQNFDLFRSIMHLLSSIRQCLWSSAHVFTIIIIIFIVVVVVYVACAKCKWQDNDSGKLLKTSITLTQMNISGCVRL